jgi:DNA ligase (NAD+)
LGLNFAQNKSEKKGTSLDKLSFVITGTFEKISRDSLKDIILNNGGKVVSSVSSKSIIISGLNPGPSKMNKAKDLGNEPLSLEDFINLYNINI